VKLRAATKKDMTAVYMMGFDVWAGRESGSDYLTGCAADKKYELGQWYGLEVEQSSDLVSSLIIYRNCFGLADKYYGFGSIATVPLHRNNGYATALIELCIQKLKKDSAMGVYLLSDIDPGFYSRIGFSSVESYEETRLMFLSLNGGHSLGPPSYF